MCRLLFHKQGKRYPKTPVDILRIEADGSNCTIFLINKEKFYEYKGLCYYEELLKNHPEFMKTHRKHIINTNEMECYGDGVVVLKNGDQVPLTDEHYAEFNCRFKDGHEVF